MTLGVSVKTIANPLTEEALDVLDMFAKRASVRSPFVPADSFRMDENKAEAR